MANLELEIDVDRDTALQCLYETAKESLVEEVYLDELLNTLFLRTKYKAALNSSVCAYYFAVSAVSETKSRLSVSGDYYKGVALSQGYILQYLSEFLEKFSAKLKEKI